MKNIIKGGEYLIKNTEASAVFTPEDYSEEILMLRESMLKFIMQEVEPIKEKFDSKEGTEIAPKLLDKLGELGFLGIAVPEEYGGMNSDLKTELATGEMFALGYSFSQSMGLHTGLGIYPILMYGTQAQKDEYLPKIVSAEIKPCYCLTEPSAGSDANSGKTKAVFTEDKKHFILNGQKMWITNSGFADIFFVFCKIEDDENISCLLVKKEWGVKLGAEERKLGIHGSSTRQVFFENIKVPVENLIGERNKGFKIAMNALNLGRLKIAVANSAMGKKAVKLAVNYANQRVQFGEAISNFGAIKHKIANMGIKIYAIESIWNRGAQQIDEAYEAYIGEGMKEIDAKIKAAAEFAMECAMTKVYGSEAEAYIVDEAMQIHGGMGYSAESEIETHYRNIRGNRIYEGTSEINRLLIPTTLLRKALKGEIDLMTPAMQAMQDLQSGNIKGAEASNEAFGTEIQFLANIKKASLLVAGQAMQTFQQKLKDEQEVLMNLADILTQVYVFESALLRTQKNPNHQNIEIRKDLISVLMHESADILKTATKEVVYAAASEEMAGTILRGINKLFQLPAANLKEKRRNVANHIISNNEYVI
jgi:alkylation response protein AidB-like acyl-CoA dehydrogenase